MSKAVTLITALLAGAAAAMHHSRESFDPQREYSRELRGNHGKRAKSSFKQNKRRGL